MKGVPIIKNQEIAKLTLVSKTHWVIEHPTYRALRWKQSVNTDILLPFHYYESFFD
jgi:hypothetical protein